MVCFAKNSGRKSGKAPLERPLFHGSLPPHGYLAVTNVDLCRIEGLFL